MGENEVYVNGRILLLFDTMQLTFLPVIIKSSLFRVNPCIYNMWLEELVGYNHI